MTSLLDAMLGMDGEATGFENIRMRGLFLGLSPKQIEAITDEVVEFSELGDFINMPVRTYSSGMVLRLAFSISTSCPTMVRKRRSIQYYFRYSPFDRGFWF